VSRVAVATTSKLAADAAEELSAVGGNAVDCALAASFLTVNTEPGVCALGGSAFITIWPANRDPVTIDGNVAVPGIGLADDERGLGGVEVELDYGGGVRTIVGPGSVAVPGTLAAMYHAWEKFGSVPWREILAPTIRACREGFPLPAACRYYLGYSGELVFGRSRDGRAALHRPDDSLYDAGERIVVPHLADTLEAIAEEGARVFYEGDIAGRITRHIRDGGGMLTADDLASYRAVERAPLLADIGDWQLASNPPPAVGGAMLTAMLLACGDLDHGGWNAASLGRLIDAQRACLDFRQRHLDLAEDVAPAAARLVELAREGALLARWSSSATVHTSVVDDAGEGCAITASSGYGSGEMPDDTGLWLNNCLGEIELNRRGLDAGPPGSRLPSNMAPSVARRPGAVLAVGSPGADRITTAMQQFLINYLQFRMPLEAAVSHPRLHVDTSGPVVQLKSEPGLDLPETDLPLSVFPGLSMYFGGVGAAVFDEGSGFEAAADPRREGGIYNPDT